MTMTRARQRRPRRPIGTKEDPVRSVRISDDLWIPARRRAEREGVTMSHVLVSIVEGYANKAIDLPRVQVHYGPVETPPSVEAVPADEPIAKVHPWRKP